MEPTALTYGNIYLTVGAAGAAGAALIIGVQHLVPLAVRGIKAARTAVAARLSRAEKVVVTDIDAVAARVRSTVTADIEEAVSKTAARVEQVTANLDGRLLTVEGHIAALQGKPPPAPSGLVTTPAAAPVAAKAA